MKIKISNQDTIARLEVSTKFMGQRIEIYKNDRGIKNIRDLEQFLKEALEHVNKIVED